MGSNPIESRSIIEKTKEEEWRPEWQDCAMRYYEYDRSGPKVVCPKCGRKMSTKLIRCAFCGERLSDTFPVQCKTCHAQVPVRNAYHAGRGDDAFLYCNQCTTALTWFIYDPGYVKVVGHAAFPWNLTQNERDEVERHLVRCPCGGQFLFKNPLKCPVCGGLFSEPISESSQEVIIIDRHIDGEKTTIWK